LLPQGWPNLVDVNRIVAEKDALLLVNGNDEPFLRNFLNAARARDIELDAGLQNRCRHHKDNQQHQYDVNERRDINVRDRCLSAPIGGREFHQRRTSAGAGWRSTAFSISSAKSSLRAAKSRMALPS